MSVDEFQNAVWQYYGRDGRTMPWRTNTDPYWILVSEMMLQQTQVDRVIPKFEQFIEVFPNIKKLADAKLSEVITVWSGLGYNRRARFILETAQLIIAEMNGKIPNDQKKLESLPGIGPNTASAIRVYAFNEPLVFIETNIRAAIIHAFFDDKDELVDDKEILAYVNAVVETENPREWYWALMDYGSHVKKAHRNPARRSASYKKQSPFEGSKRQIRGKVLRLLISGPATLPQLTKNIADERMITVLDQLEAEGMIRIQNGRYSLLS